MTGSFMGRGNQFLKLVKVLYCKLLTNGKRNGTPISKVGSENVATLPPWLLYMLDHLLNIPLLLA